MRRIFISPALKHRANENAEKEFSALFCTVCLARHSCSPVELPDTCQFLLHLQQADRAYHVADRDPGIIGPEDAAILVFVVVEADFVTVDLPERFSFL